MDGIEPRQVAVVTLADDRDPLAAGFLEPTRKAPRAHALAGAAASG